jgi:hypothetical protein
LLKPTDVGASFKAVGSVNGEQAVQMRIELAYFNLSERNPELSAIDARLIEHHRRRWELLRTHSPELRLAEPAQG